MYLIIPHAFSYLCVSIGLYQPVYAYMSRRVVQWWRASLRVESWAVDIRKGIQALRAGLSNKNSLERKPC